MISPEKTKDNDRSRKTNIKNLRDAKKNGREDILGGTYQSAGCLRFEPGQYSYRDNALE